MFSMMGVVQGEWRNVGVSGKYSFGFGGVKFKGVGSKPSVYGVDARGDSVMGMSRCSSGRAEGHQRRYERKCLGSRKRFGTWGGGKC